MRRVPLSCARWRTRIHFPGWRMCSALPTQWAEPLQSHSVLWCARTLVEPLQSHSASWCAWTWVEPLQSHSASWCAWNLVELVPATVHRGTHELRWGLCRATVPRGAHELWHLHISLCPQIWSFMLALHFSNTSRRFDLLTCRDRNNALLSLRDDSYHLLHNCVFKLNLQVKIANALTEGCIVE
jgi:hypothetical protein